MIKRIDVVANKVKVGTLAISNDGVVAFQYTDDWIEKGFSINPFKLPLSKQVYYANSPYFMGLFGVFAWGIALRSIFKKQEREYRWYHLLRQIGLYWFDRNGPLGIYS